MLSCEQAKNLLSAYYDGELGVAAANEVAEHLESCEQCRKDYEDMSLLSSAFLRLKPPEIDEKFRASLSEKLADISKNKKPKGFGVWAMKMRPYIAAAACFVLVVGVYAAVHKGQVLTNTTTPEMVQFLPDENREDIKIQTEEILATPKADTEKEDAAENQNTKYTYNLKTTKSVNDTAVAEKNTINAQAEFSVLDEADENTLANSRAVVEDETNQPAQGEVIAPLSTQAPSDVAEENLSDENTQSHGGGGGGSSVQIKAATAQFVLLDKERLDALKDILYNYGTCDISENYIHLMVLSANYNACIEVLSRLEWLEASEIEAVTDSEYCYIQINIQ